MVLSTISLDTSAYSAFMRGETAAKDVLQRADHILLSQIVIGELAFGFARGRFPQKNWQELYRFLDSPRVQVVDIDFDTALHYAQVLAQLQKNGTPIPTNDIWLAASTIRHAAALVTSDHHFARVDGLMRHML